MLTSVVWKNAVICLDEGNKFFKYKQDARIFIEQYLHPIIDILLSQQPTEPGTHENMYCQQCLSLAMWIISTDLDIQNKRKGECKVLNVLSLVFDKTKTYFKNERSNETLFRTPPIRIKMIEHFRYEQGFSRLYRYMVDRINTSYFPSMDILHPILISLGDAANDVRKKVNKFTLLLILQLAKPAHP